MKHTFYSMSIALVVGVLFFSGCANPFDSKPDSGDAQGNLGRVAIQVGSPARTLQPAFAFDKYELAFTGPTGASHETETITTGTTATVDLAPGEWIITVTAFTGTDDAAKQSAQGSDTVTVTANQTVPVAITLTPYTGEGAEKGTFGYSVTYPAGIKAGTLVITETDATTVEGGSINLLEGTNKTGTLSLPAGQYKMQIRLTANDDMIAGRTEALHIYPTLTSSAAYVFTGADFVAFAEMADKNIDGTAKIDTEVTPVNAEVTITLYNDSFKEAFTPTTDLSGWITNLPAGLAVAPKGYLEEGATEITLSITGIPTEVSSAELAITIPAASLSSGKTLTVRPNPNAKFAIGLPVATAAAVPSGTLSGETEKALAWTLTITLTNETFKAIAAANQNVTAWFTDLPKGLSAAAAVIAEGVKTLTVNITGTPTAVVESGELTISIPAESLSRGEALTVTGSLGFTVAENSMNGVYIVGQVGNGASTNPYIAHYWKRNKETGAAIDHDTLQAEESGKNAVFSAVAVVGDDVHIAGMYGENAFVYRKNDNDIILEVEGETYAFASPLMAVDGDITYVVTTWSMNPYYCWVIQNDGSKTPYSFSLENSGYIACVSVDEDYLYFGGYSMDDDYKLYATYWKYSKTTNALEGSPVILNDKTAATVNSMTISGNTLYLAGNTYDENYTPFAVYWTAPKNGGAVVEKILETENESIVNAIAVSDNGDVHLAGYWRPLSTQTNRYYGAIAAYWKVSGGTPQPVNKITEPRNNLVSSVYIHDEGLGIAVDGADVYIAGYISNVSGESGPNKPVYWKYTNEDTLQPPVELEAALGISQARAIAVR